MDVHEERITPDRRVVAAGPAPPPLLYSPIAVSPLHPAAKKARVSKRAAQSS